MNYLFITELISKHLSQYLLKSNREGLNNTQP